MSLLRLACCLGYSCFVLLVAPAAMACALETDTAPVSKPGESASLSLDHVLEIQQLASPRVDELRQAFAQASPAELEALAFLLQYMPPHDLQQLDVALLKENIEYACRVRQEVPWSESLNDELFYNYVLPYACVNERRDAWRKDFYDRFIDIAMECETPGEAAVRLNKEIFDEVGVHYHATRRQKPDQSPYESMELGYASCTGLSIILVDACRAVGVPARVVGIPDWGGHSGNHTWTEVWDNYWRFTGSAEPANSLDVTWFSGRASHADASQPETTIYATSYRQTDTSFPMVWSRHLDYVSAHDVTGFYTTRRQVTFEDNGLPAGSRLELYLGDQLVAAGPLAEPLTVSIAGDAAYRAVIVEADGSVLNGQTVEISDEAEQKVPLSVASSTASE